MGIYKALGTAALSLALVAGHAPGQTVAAAAESPVDGKAASLEAASNAELIAELGSEDYAVRRRAEEELSARGADAFDELKGAEESSDLEIAARAQYILEHLRVEWPRASDPDEVRQLLATYGDDSDDAKRRLITRIARVKDEGGLPALCRIARYEPSPVIARRAALAFLRERRSDEGKSEAKTQASAKACLAELGGSERAPAEWIRLALDETSPAAELARRWNAAIDAELKLAEDNSRETDALAAYDLLERHLDWCMHEKLVDETTATLEKTISLAMRESQRSDPSTGLTWGLRWIIENRQWQVLEKFRAAHGDAIKKDRLLLYYLAAATSKAGDPIDGEKLADRAFRLAAGNSQERLTGATTVASLGFIPWAEREYRDVLSREPVVSAASLTARVELAQWLADREDYRGAANLLGEMADALDAESGARERFVRKLEESGESGRESLSAALARREYYAACDFELKKDFKRQRERLEIAAATNGSDPDILIAMYRSPGADEEFRKLTLVRIRRESKSLQGLIDENPRYASLYNQWAWLIANTEGDYQRAVEYSKKSLELSPDESSFLDTLGRCYYAAGDLEHAVESQRKAVELAPHYQVMKRQLALFQSELAARGDHQASEPKKTSEQANEANPEEKE